MPKAKIAENENWPKKKLPKGKIADSFSPWQKNLNYVELGTSTLISILLMILLKI